MHCAKWVGPSSPWHYCTLPMSFHPFLCLQAGLLRNPRDTRVLLAFKVRNLPLSLYTFCSLQVCLRNHVKVMELSGDLKSCIGLCPLLSFHPPHLTCTLELQEDTLSRNEFTDHFANLFFLIAGYFLNLFISGLKKIMS